MRKLKLLALMFLLLCCVDVRAQQVDLANTNQTKNITPTSRGGTGGATFSQFTLLGNNTNSTAAITAISMDSLFGNCANGLTYSTSTHTFSCLSAASFSGLSGTLTLPTQCPTCLAGPNVSIVGGFIGGTSNGTQFSGARSAGFWIAQQVSNVNFPSPISFSFANPSVEIRAASTTAQSGAQIGVAVGGSIPTNDPWLPLSLSANTAYVISSAPLQSVGAGQLITFAILSNSTTSATLGEFSGEIVGIDAQILGMQAINSTVTASTTIYTGPSMPNSLGQTTQNLVAVPMPWSSGATAENFCAYWATANAAGGATTVTLNKALAASVNSFSATSVTFSVPLSSTAATVYCDGTHTATFAQFDVMTWQFTNANASAASGQIQGVSLELIPSGSSTFIVVFGTSGLSLANAGSSYGDAFLNRIDSTESNAYAPMPRAATASVLACYVTTAPLVSSEVVTLRKNGASPGSGLTITIPVGQSVPAVISDTSHTVSFAQGDQFDLQYTSGAGGTAAVISSCVISD